MAIRAAGRGGLDLFVPADAAAGRAGLECLPPTPVSGPRSSEMAPSVMRRDRRARSRVRRTALLLTSLLVCLGLPAGLPTASADGPTTYSQTTALAIPATGSANQIGPADPYPSGVVVSGMTGAVSAVTVS